MSQPGDFQTSVKNPRDDQRDAFLEHIEVKYRGNAMNYFLHEVRNGTICPDEIIAKVKRSLRNLLQRQEFYEGKRNDPSMDGVLAAINQCPAEALGLAEYCIWWESLSNTRKAEIKGRRAKAYIHLYMETQPATEKQISYLRKLGFTGEVGSKLHASRLIDGLLPY